jgi:hypothetical protein
MSQRLFTTEKVALFVQSVSLGKEKRKDGEEATILKLGVHLDPFTPELANAIDEGLGGDTNVRASVFTLGTGEPKPHLERIDLGLACPRQRMDIYASPDTETSRLCFDQVKVQSFYVRTQKDADTLTAVLKLAFGPFSKDELEAATQYFRSQLFVTFQEAEPTLPIAEDTDDVPAAGSMWDERPAESPADRENASRPTARRGSKQRSNPEAERAAQVDAGRQHVEV